MRAGGRNALAELPSWLPPPKHARPATGRDGAFCASRIQPCSGKLRRRWQRASFVSCPRETTGSALSCTTHDFNQACSPFACSVTSSVRRYSAIAAGCLPVILCDRLKPSSLPFHTRVPWERYDNVQTRPRGSCAHALMSGRTSLGHAFTGSG